MGGSAIMGSGGGGWERRWETAERGAVTEVFRMPMKKFGKRARRKKRRKPIVRMFEFFRAVFLLLLFLFVDGGMDAVLDLVGWETSSVSALST